MTADLTAFQSVLGYRFQEPSYLDMALTHSTWAYENRRAGVSNNQRLEFLGDSVLGLTVSTHLYREMSDLPEGKLSKLRAQIVCEETLYRVAKTIGLGSVLKLGNGESLSGGHDKPSNLSDCLEAVFGAVYLDGGFDAAFELITRLLMPYYRQAIEGRLIYDFKTTLIERVQAMGADHSISFVLQRAEGPVHAMEFEVMVFIDNKPYGSGTGHAKKAAEQRAAERTLNML